MHAADEGRSDPGIAVAARGKRSAESDKYNTDIASGVVVAARWKRSAESDEYDTGIATGVVVAARGERSAESDEYDTDLEENARGWENPKAYVGVACYQHTCSRIEVAIQQAVIQGLDQPTLTLRHRNLGPLNIQPLALALVKNTRVTTLDLEDTGLGPEGAKYVAAMLLENDFLHTVDLSNNKAGVEGARALGEVVRFNRSLICLVLAGNDFGDAGIELIAAPLQSNDEIAELDLSNNKVEFGGQYIGTALSINSSLERLNLSWNSLHGPGAVSFCKGLHRNRCLTDLDLSFNGLGYHGALALGKMLKINKTLKHLNVSNNNITWHGAIMIADGLKVNGVLDTLKIGENPLTTTGCQDILDAIAEKGCRLKYLSLKKVAVVGEFEMMAIAIRQSRAFDYEHGGVVNSHDVLGQRLDRRLHPMDKVLKYMKERGLRATELFRTFDKTVSNRLAHETFIERLKIAGVDMQRHELEALLAQIQRRGSRIELGDAIDYKKMNKSIQEHLERDRIRQIKERERTRKVKEYHKKILQSGTVANLTEAEVYDAFSDDRSLSSLISELKALKAGSTRHSSTKDARTMLPRIQTRTSNAETMISRQSTPLQQGQTGRPHKTVVMSMSRALGAKAKAFGAAESKKKKRKRKKRKH